MLYYFAYGSNMDLKQMRERCPDSKFFGKALLINYKIEFTIFSPKRKCGCADILESKGYEVWGILYEINSSDLKRLDGFESHPDKYKRFSVTVISESGKKITAEIYEVVNKSIEKLYPSKNYLGLIIKAVKLFNFPKNYLLPLLNMKTVD